MYIYITSTLLITLCNQNNQFKTNLEGAGLLKANLISVIVIYIQNPLISTQYKTHTTRIQ